MNEVKRTPEFLKAAEELMPILKAIPKEAIRRHNLLFENIINNTIKEQGRWNPKPSLSELLAIDLPYYLSYGINKHDYDKIVI